MKCYYCGEDDENERHLSSLLLCPDERRYVPCDESCKALNHPQTLEEYKAALDHWKNHKYLAGCSHSR